MPLPNPKDGVGEVPPFGPPNPPVGMDAKRLGRALPEFAARAAAPLAPRFFSGAILRLLAVARRLFLKKRRGGKGGGGGEKRREKKEKEKRKKERKKRKKKERTERKKKKEEKKKTVKKRWVHTCAWPRLKGQPACSDPCYRPDHHHRRLQQ